MRNFCKCINKIYDYVMAFTPVNAATSSKKKWKPAFVRSVGRKRTIDHFESLNSRFGIPQAVMARGKATAA